MARASNRKIAPVETPVAEAPKGEPNLAKLQALVNATQSGGAIYVPQNDPDLILLTSLQLADTNPALINEEGNIATRATQAGIKYMSLQETPQPSAPAVVNSAVEYDDVPLPTVKRGRAATGKREFDLDAIPVGKSLHIPVTAKRDDPGKSLASMVSQFNAKFAVETGEMETVKVPVYTTDENGKRVKSDGHFVKTGMQEVTRPITKQSREYVIRTVGADDIRGAGARIFRLK